MVEEEGELIQTQNEGELFMHKNYLYTINSVSKRGPELKFYTCMERKTCSGRVHVQDGKYLKAVTEYSYLADKAKVEARLSDQDLWDWRGVAPLRLYPGR